MEASSNLENLSPALMKPFDLRTIERALRDLWKEDKVETTDKPKRVTMRACIINFLIYSEAAEDIIAEVGRLNETIIDITKHHPSRVIVMSARENSLSEGMEADVAAVCQFIPGRGKQVCSEEIVVSAQGSAVKRLPAAVMPLLVSDLPVAIWWRGTPSNPQLFNGLLKAADRAILDTNTTQRPTAFLSVLASMVKERKDIAFSDLNWARLTQLRSHIASLFDVPDLLQYLKDLTKVSVEFPSVTVDKDLPSPQAVMFVGWLASRLGWQKEPDVFHSKNGTHILKYRKDQHEVSVDLVPVSSMKTQDMRIVLTMADDTGWQQARIVVNRIADRNVIETKLETPTICWLKEVAKYQLPCEAELLSRELEILGHDAVYEAALEKAANLVDLM
ncbi:MAG: glucose-6-phosphate dehydrogenase assembly protein OpcA [Blastocatellia bacterium]|nr:glucose-6-phosphate dehydrogenase assembly protein OpcA [Blastocatellia bacterium]